MDIVLGPIVALLIQWAKNKFGTNNAATLACVALLSLVAASVYTYFANIGLWPLFAKVLVMAGAFYTFVIRQFEVAK